MENEICTASINGKILINQYMSKCNDCDIIVCMYCLATCHFGHSVSSIFLTDGYCQCYNNCRNNNPYLNGTLCLPIKKQSDNTAIKIKNASNDNEYKTLNFIYGMNIISDITHVIGIDALYKINVHKNIVISPINIVMSMLTFYINTSGHAEMELKFLFKDYDKYKLNDFYKIIHKLYNTHNIIISPKKLNTKCDFFVNYDSSELESANNYIKSIVKSNNNFILQNDYSDNILMYNYLEYSPIINIDNIITDAFYNENIKLNKTIEYIQMFNRTCKSYNNGVFELIEFTDNIYSLGILMSHVDIKKPKISGSEIITFISMLKDEIYGEITFPNINCSNKLKLNGIIRNMGINDIFKEQYIDNYTLDKIIHYVSININWNMETRENPEISNTKKFKVNTPFIYYVRHGMSNNFLLFGYFM